MTILTAIIFLCMFALIGALTARLAKHKGRDPVMWFWFGVCFGIIAIMVLYFLKDQKEEEKLEILPAQEEEKQEKLESSGVWYILDQKHLPLGPLSFDDIKTKFKEGTLTMSSYLWHEEWPEWKRASEVPGIKSSISL